MNAELKELLSDEYTLAFLFDGERFVYQAGLQVVDDE